MRRGLALSFALAALLACQSSRHGANVDGTYVAPDGLFSVPLPERIAGERTDEYFVKDAFTVAFSDDFGTLFRIDGVSVAVAGFREAEEREKALATFFDAASMAAFKQASPAAAAAREDYLADVFGGALLYKVNLPGGSTLQVEENGGPPHRMDSTRAVILFVQAGNVVQVSTQALELPGSARTTEDAWQAAKASALQFAKSIRFQGA